MARRQTRVVPAVPRATPARIELLSPDLLFGHDARPRLLHRTLHGFSSAWCRRTTPERGSTERVRERETPTAAPTALARRDTCAKRIGEIDLTVAGFQNRLVERLDAAEVVNGCRSFLTTMDQ